MTAAQATAGTAAIGAVVLAAGQGTRLGSVAKALLAAGDGGTFLSAIIATLRAAGVPDAAVVIVVAEPHAAAVTAAAHALGVGTAVNHAPARGMVSSLAVGLEALAGRAPNELVAALSWPADTPRVTPATLRALAAAARENEVVVPAHDDRGGHPVLLGRNLWPDVTRAAAAPDGLRSLRGALGERWRRLPVDDAFVLADVDTAADLARMSR